MTGLALDSRTLAAGEVFLAYPGARHDGRDFIPGALKRGAAAVLWESEGFEWNAAWRVPNLGVGNLRRIAGFLAHEVYGRPSEKLWTMGVTGTNGKTSCSHWIAQACGACGARTAVIGTLGTGFPALPGSKEPGKFDAGVNTTPDAVALHRSLAQLLATGAQGVAMEVTSIGLEQGRVTVSLSGPPCSPISRAITSTITATWRTMRARNSACSKCRGSSTPCSIWTTCRERGSPECSPGAA